MGIDTRNMVLRDVDRAIKLRPEWFKGYSRRGDALFKLEQFDDAIESYEHALSMRISLARGTARATAGSSARTSAPSTCAWSATIRSV